MHNIFCLTKAEVLLPPLTQSSPSPIEVCPQAPCLKGVENLLVFLQQKTTEEIAHIKVLKTYHLWLQQVCNVCVYMSVWCISVCEIRIKT